MIARIRKIRQERALAIATLGMILLLAIFITNIIQTGFPPAAGALGYTSVLLAGAILGWLALTRNNKWGDKTEGDSRG